MTENISTIRLYKSDFTNNDLDTYRKVLTAAGLYSYVSRSTPALGSSHKEIKLTEDGKADTPVVSLSATVSKKVDIRLIAVCIKPGSTLQFANDGTTFAVGENSSKSARVKVPVKDYVDGQWVHQTSGVRIATGTGSGPIAPYVAGEDPTITGIQPVGYDNALFTVQGDIDYIDIAVRY